MMRLSFLSVLVLGLTACGQPATNDPTNPAAAVTTLEADAPPPPPAPGIGSVMPGTGPQSFVGRWAADVSWCVNTTGPEQPIEITPVSFKGYENSCTIAEIDQAADGYVATLRCESEGARAIERLKMSASGQALRLIWLDRDNAMVNLTKCTTLTDTTPTGPSLKIN